MGVPELNPSASMRPDRSNAVSGIDLFGQTVALYQSNAYLMTELEALRGKRAQALAYLHAPGSNPLLAQARIAQLRARHSTLLTMLRANRIAARNLLQQSTPEADCPW